MGLEQFERELEPLGLLGIERERDPGIARGDAQVHEARSEVRQHLAPMGSLEARMHGRELDRDARRASASAYRRRVHAAPDRARVRREIAGPHRAPVRAASPSMSNV